MGQGRIIWIENGLCSGKEVFTYGIWFGSYANNYHDLPYKRRDASIRNVQASKLYEKPHFCTEFFGIDTYYPALNYFFRAIGIVALG